MNYNNPDLDAGRYFDHSADVDAQAEKALAVAEQEYIEIMEQLEALLVANGFERDVIDCLVEENIHLANMLDARAVRDIV